MNALFFQHLKFLLFGSFYESFLLCNFLYWSDWNIIAKVKSVQRNKRFSFYFSTHVTKFFHKNTEPSIKWFYSIRVYLLLFCNLFSMFSNMLWVIWSWPLPICFWHSTVSLFGIKYKYIKQPWKTVQILIR